MNYCKFCCILAKESIRALVSHSIVSGGEQTNIQQNKQKNKQTVCRFEGNHARRSLDGSPGVKRAIPKGQRSRPSSAQLSLAQLELLAQPLPPDPWTLGPLDPWPFGTLAPWTPGPLNSWTLGPFDAWTLGPLAPWTLGPLDPWTLGPLAPWTPWPLGPLYPWPL